MATPTENGIITSDVLSFTGENSVDGIIGGTKWGGTIGTPVTLTYSFSSPNSVYADNYPGEESADGLNSLTETQKEAAEAALAAWSEIANIKFELVEESENLVGDIRFARYTGSESDTAHAYFPSTNPAAGDIWFSDKQSYDTSEKGTYGYATFMHEIGHALGLKHPHDTEDKNQTVVDLEKDTTAFSIMSYRSYVGADVNSGYSQDFYPTTPMLSDIAAIQHLYGANMNTRKGNDNYDWKYLTGDGKQRQILTTIWDAGGNDTIDWSDQSSAAKINLNAGEWSDLGPAYRNGKGQETVNQTLAIAYNVTIENAIGGFGNDEITGNKAKNQLQGADGRDTLIGGDGGDTFVFKSATEGVDTIEDFDRQEGDKILFDATAEASQFKYNAQTGEISFNDRVFVTLANTPADFTIGTDLVFNDTTPDDPEPPVDPVDPSLIGTNGDDILVSRSDQGDSVLGLAGNDQITGGLGDDTLDGGAGNDTLSGGAGNDILMGQDGNDSLDGGIGNDTLSGGTGDDFYTVDSATDVVTELINQGHDTVLSSTSYTLSDNIEDLTLTGTSTVNGTGNSLDNIMFGNAANNYLYAGDGADQVDGDAGNDYLYGQAGDDTLNGGNGKDWLVGDLGDDLISGGRGNDRLIGGLGKDSLSGEKGKDRLTGGADADRFVFDSLKQGFDIITDFKAAQGDQIVVSAKKFGGDLKRGKVRSGQFTLGSKTVDDKTGFVYNQSSGRLFFDVDGIGGQKQIQVAKLAGGTGLTNSDIFVV